MKTLPLLAIGIMALLSGTSYAQTRSNAPIITRSNALVITSPVNGTVVAPGEAITVSVTVNSGTYPNGVAIVGGEGGGPSVMQAPGSGLSSVTAPAALSFSVTIPTNAFPGKFGISAFGPDSSRTLQGSDEITLDVERTDSPVRLRVDPPSLHLNFVGDSQDLTVIGIYQDRSWHGLSQSSLLQITSENTAVAIVKNGIIIASGPGNTTIQVSYGSTTATVAVSVPSSISGDLNGDGRVDMEDVNIDKAALGQPDTVPNDARDPMGAGKVTAEDVQAIILRCTYTNCSSTPP
jgi:hypothetical protein